jgi:predicted secreted hydrolase
MGARDAARRPDGKVVRYAPDQVAFHAAGAVEVAAHECRISGRNHDRDRRHALADQAPAADQELDSRRSTGAVYWEGAVTLERDGVPAGRGYLEMTGYARPMKL